MNSPFKFLDAFNKEDKTIFFGRSTDIKSLFEKVHKGKLLLVYGASGTGKTSLIQCGLANQFQDTDWFPLIIRRNQNILKSTLNQISTNAITPISDKKNFSQDNLKAAVESLYLDFYKPLFLIYDQFEELFISGEEDEIIFFFESLQTFLTSGIQVKVILVIREEYLANLTNMEYLIPDLFENRKRVEKMSASNIREVIQNSCNVFGIRLEDDGVPNKIYEKLVGDDGSVELTHLQVFLDSLYKLAYKNDPKNIVFSNELLENVGQLDDVLATFLSEQVNNLEDPKLGWKVLKLFVTEKGTKKSIERETIKSLIHHNNIPEKEGLVIIETFLQKQSFKNYRK